MIEAKDLAYILEGREIFSNLNFKINKGEKKLLLGNNGSGKSSLLGMIQGFILPSQGKILKSKDLKISYLFQDSLDQFIAPTVVEDVAFSLIAKDGFIQEEAYVCAMAILEKLQIAHLAQQSIFSLSGGEKRLVAIAGVLVCECDLYLLDEPFNELDQKRCQIVEEMILKKDGACLVASHQETDWGNFLQL